jgi:hypothetical protein
MELVDLLRILARHRIALGCGLLVAVLAAVVVQYQVSLSPFSLTERVTKSSTAQTRLLVDAPDKPSTLDLDAGVADTLGLRAGLLADLLATDGVRDDIARQSGLQPSDLAVLAPASSPPSLPVPLAVAASDAASVTREPYVLSAAADVSIPIVSLSVAAPDTASAKRILQAAMGEYKDLVQERLSTGTIELTVEPLGEIRTTTTVDRMHPAIGVGVAIAVFTLWAVALLLLVGLRRAWRGAAQPVTA